MHGVARVLSKLGVCSRSHAEAAVRAGRVTVDGRTVTDPEHRVAMSRARLTLDGAPVERAQAVYIALNKPRGLVVSTADERGRDTVYALLAEAPLPWIAPVGRLDRASEGLLLLSNDTAWAAGITDPAGALHKTYHVQIDGLPSAEMLARLQAGVMDAGEHLGAVSARLLRHGSRNAWLEIVLDEGRNRHIRRLLAALGYEVVRLLRVSIGPVSLGSLAKGGWRHLGADEVASLRVR